MDQPRTADIDLRRFAELGNGILPQLGEMQLADPLVWSETNRCWIATGHDVVADGFSGRLPLSAKRHQIIASFFPDPSERKARIGYLLQIFPLFLVSTDPPEQLRLRKLLMGAFTKPVAESYRPFVRQVVAEVMREIEQAKEIDFLSQVARPVTARAILHVMGLSQGLLPRMEYWAQTITSGLSGVPHRELIAQASDVLEEMRDVFEAEIAQRKDSLADDFLGVLLASQDGNDRLTHDEVIAQLVLILIAGHDTTMNTLALSVAALADRPAERAYMRERPERFEACIMELMRVIAMSTSMGRVVTDDFEWQGKRLKKGDFVFLMIAAANRDPLVFPDPERIDFDRSQQGNMTFAPGAHFCIGHWFAKMMMSEVLPAFLDRYDGWDVVGEQLTFTSATGFRGPVRLGLRLTPSVGPQHV